MKTIRIFFLIFFALLLNFPVHAAEPSAVTKDWTFMVFLNGDNNLDEYGSADMREMESAGSSKQVNILVLRDTSDQSVSSKIYLVERGKSTVVKDFGKNIDMGDWRNMVEFFKFSQEKYPARKYAMDVWNHGAGWRLEMRDPITRGISYDDGSGNHISTPQLGEAFRAMKELNDGRPIDLFGMDACLMQMAEVIFEVSDSVNVVVGSEDTEPGDGWAYSQFLSALNAKPTMDAEELGTVIEREYAQSYDGGVQGTQSVQGSAVSAIRLASALTKFDAFLGYALEIAPTYQSALKIAMSGAQHYYYSEFRDVIHFVKLAKKGVRDARFQALADEVLAEFSGAVIANFVTGSGLNDSHGFSFWVPTEGLFTSKKAEYAQLKWAQNTRWIEFLEYMLFPTVPVVSFKSVDVFDANSDGFISPGEKLSFRVQLRNDSSIPAKNVTVSLEVPSGVIVGGEVAVDEIDQGLKIIDGLSATLPEKIAGGLHSFKVIVKMPGYVTIEKEFSVNVDADYTFEDYALSSPHDYQANSDRTWTVSKPGVKGFRLHFSKFGTEARFDFVTLEDKNGNELEKYDGNRSPFWSPFIEGDSVVIRLKSDVSVNGYGFDIDQIAY